MVLRTREPRCVQVFFAGLEDGGVRLGEQVAVQLAEGAVHGEGVLRAGKAE